MPRLSEYTPTAPSAVPLDALRRATEASRSASAAPALPAAPASATAPTNPRATPVAPSPATRPAPAARQVPGSRSDAARPVRGPAVAGSGATRARLFTADRVATTGPRSAPRVTPRARGLAPTGLACRGAHAARGAERPAAGDRGGWSVFCWALVPVALLLCGASFGGAAGTALGLAAVTATCRALLRRAERRGSRMTEERRRGVCRGRARTAPAGPVVDAPSEAHTPVD
ncbi:hypothetical protein [Streptomyces buecherae]|uniref:hypothetical protein n=1 Tax=Streptomyces buecherae TaxID=2763006 RepID=UPI0036A1331A